ncbi:hypothetical protein ACFFGT_13205 [Mucilaginibacter angelicae]|uniref:DUF4145 domain-containing protein n=1 Tax=Mucilaginibacter angelicae TaxID=869718 RepID=A0ABV6L6S6_9SPHI
MILGKLQVRVAAICLFVIASLSLYQDKLHIKMDAATILTFCLSIILFILPDLSSLSKFKIGDLEVEFKKEVDKLEKLVQEEEKSDYTNSLRAADKESWQYYYQEYQSILQSANSNSEKLLRASQLVEQMIMVAGKDFELDANKLKSPAMVVIELRNAGLISEEELSLYKEFQALRNNIIHRDVSQLDDTLTVRILDLLLRIIRIFG